MQYVLVRLKLEDYTKWKAVFDEFGSFRKTAGSKGGQLFQKSGNPNEVVVLLEWDDLEKGRRYFQSDELRQGLQRAGVSGPPDVQYLNQVEKLSM
jgi:heme-degrading monooxygenase HmoA